MTRVLSRIGVVCLTAALTRTVSARAQDPSTAPIAPGRVTDSVVSLADTTQSYAVYLPSRYDTTRVWPVLFAMDPRGRALIPLRLFEEAAEDRGYIIMSSYNTASDVVGEDPNERAFSAMLEDAQRRFVVHPNRVYLTGFSGTARVSWLLARRLPGAAAGILLAGAGLPTPLADQVVAANWDTTLAVFAAAGRWDFNYEEVLDLDAQLDRVGSPHHVRFFDGLHSWFPDSLAADGLAFMDLQAMRSGLLPVDSAFVRQQASARLAVAEAAERNGDSYAAHRWYRAATDDLHGLLDIPRARAAYERLDESPAVRREIERREQATATFRRRMRRFHELRERVRTAERPPTASDLIDELEVERLIRTAEEEAGTYEGDAARRLLESIFVSVSFYDPRSYLASQDWSRAQIVLELAHHIRPEHPRVCFDLARVYAQSGAPDQAMDALRCAVENGRVSLDSIRSHPDLEVLRDRDDFRALLSRPPG